MLASGGSGYAWNAFMKDDMAFSDQTEVRW